MGCCPSCEKVLICLGKEVEKGVAVGLESIDALNHEVLEWSENQIDDIKDALTALGMDDAKKDLDYVVWEISKGIDKIRLSATVIPGVYIYNGIHGKVTELLNTHLEGELGIVKETKGLNKVFGTLQGKPREITNYRIAWNALAKKVGYEAKTGFPDRMDPSMLKKIIAHNTFIASGLSFEEKQICFNATKNSKNPMTAKIFGCFKNENFAISKVYIKPDFSELTLFVNDEEVKYDKNDISKWDRAVSIFITSIMYFFELQHAVLHVFAYVMLGAALHAVEDTPLADFMRQYNKQVLIKYIEVESLLLNKNGIVAGGVWPVDGDLVGACTTQLFIHFASASNAKEWFYNICLGGVAELKDNKHILPECRNYLELFDDMSTDALKLIPEASRKKINLGIKKYLGYTAGVEQFPNGHFKINNFCDWIQCQSMMGIYHGNTIGLTRLILSPWCNPFGNWDEKVIGKVAFLWTIAAATTFGLQKEHAVTEPDVLKDTVFHQMMVGFNSKSQKIQSKFWNALDEDDRKLYGWIQSVWGPNMTDQTQLTATTYI